MKLSKLDTIEKFNSNYQMREDIKVLISTAFKCKISAIDLLIKYCDANNLTYSSDFSSYCLNQFCNLEL